MYAGENNKANGGFEHSGLFGWLIKWHYKMQEGWFCNPILYYDGLEKWGKEIFNRI
jgi:protein SCO1/2